MGRDLNDEIRTAKWQRREYRTSRSRDSAAKGDEGSNVCVKELVHLLYELKPDARVATDERVHTDEDSASNPGFGHAGRAQRIRKG